MGDSTGVLEVMGFNWASNTVGRLSGKCFLTLRLANPLEKPQDSGGSDKEEHLRVHNKNNVTSPESG